MKNLKNKVYKASHKNFYFRFFHQSTFFPLAKNYKFCSWLSAAPFLHWFWASWFFVPHTLRIHWKSLTALVNLRYSQSWSIPTDGHNQCWSIPTDGHNQRWSIPKDGSQPKLINTWGRVTTNVDQYLKMGHNQCWSIPMDGHSQSWSIPTDGHNQ